MPAKASTIPISTAMVRLPPVPTSSVWLALLIAIAEFEAAELVNFKSEADVESIVNDGPKCANVLGLRH